MATGKRGYTNSIGVSRFTNDEYVLDETTVGQQVVAIAGDTVSVACACSAASEEEETTNPITNFGPYSECSGVTTGNVNRTLSIATEVGQFRNIGWVVKKGGIFPAVILIDAVECTE